MSQRSVDAQVVVRGISHRVRERDLEKFFRKIGRVMDISMKNGYAFVEFDDYRDADDAIYELDGKELLGKRVSIAREKENQRDRDFWRGSDLPSKDYKPPTSRKRSKEQLRNINHGKNERYGDGPPTRTEYRLIVENLSSRVSCQDLKEYMRKAGEVTYAEAHTQSRNEGIVEFASYSDMKNAIKRLDDTKLKDRHIYLVEDKHRRRSRLSNSRSRSHSRSRDHSKSKSRSRRSVLKHQSESQARSRSKSASPGRWKSRSSIPPKTKRSRSRSNSIAGHKRIKVDNFGSSSDNRNSIERLDDTKLNERRINLVKDEYSRKSSSCLRSRSRSRDCSKSRTSGSVLTNRSKLPARSRSKSASSGRGKSLSLVDAALNTKRSRSKSNPIVDDKRIEIINENPHKKIAVLEKEVIELRTKHAILEGDMDHVKRCLNDMNNFIQPLQRFANFIFSRELIARS